VAEPGAAADDSSDRTKNHPKRNPPKMMMVLLVHPAVPLVNPAENNEENKHV